MSRRPTLKLTYVLVTIIIIGSLSLSIFQPNGVLAANAVQQGPVLPTAVSCVNFANLNAGQSVEGLGAAHPLLNISSTGEAVAILEGNTTVAAYGAPNAVANLGSAIVNNGVGTNGGFVDQTRTHQYTFTFAPNTTVNYFTLKMLDLGDYNPYRATSHSASLVAYNANNQQVAIDTLSYTSDNNVTPTSGSAGNLQLTGDAFTAKNNEPGNYQFQVSSSNITRLELKFNNNAQPNKISDPNTAFAVLCFDSTTFSPPQTVCLNFAALPPGASVEGLGTLHPNLNISSSGNVVSIHEGNATAPGYGAPNQVANLGDPVVNNGVGPMGGFVDVTRAHDYTFTFSPNYKVNNFSVKMLDYGDYNSLNATQHSVQLAAFNASNQQVAQDTLSFTSDSGVNPTSGSAGNLQLTGDAISALPGQPGNFTFDVTATGVTRVVLKFNNNVSANRPSDPNFGLAVLCFQPEGTSPTPSPTPTATRTPTTSPTPTASPSPTSSPTPSASPSPTPTTPPAPQTVCIDFTQLNPGDSVEGLNVLYPGLNIATSGSAVAIHDSDPTVAGFGAPNAAANLGPTIANKGLGSFGGFVDVYRNHNYRFTFAPSQSVQYFSVKMLDFGDFNPMRATSHEVSLRAYNGQNQLVATDTLSFTSDAGTNPTSGSSGNLQLTGDAVTAVQGQPGNYLFEVSATNIVRLEMFFSNNVQTGSVSDPNLGLAVLCFEPTPNIPTPGPTPSATASSTPSPTPTATSSGTPTATPSSTPTANPSGTPTATPTNTPTANPSGTPTATPTNTPTANPSGTPTATPTNTPTANPSGTPTATPSSTPTADPSGTPTATPSSTPTVTPTVPPVVPPQSCEDFGFVTLAENNWDEHIIHKMKPIDLEFGRPYGADFAIINTGWRWGGYPDQHQVTEKHSVDTPLGNTVSDDYGNEELDGQIIWYDSFAGAYSADRLPIHLDYAGDGSDPGSHFAYGQILWCAPETPTIPPTDYETCEDHNMVSVGSDSWEQHLWYKTKPKHLAFSIPQDATYGIVNTGWEWTGRPDQFQVTEKHSVETVLGLTTSDDYGNEELVDLILWYDQLSGPVNGTTFNVTIKYAGNGSDPGSHASHGFIDWCRAP